MSIRFTGFPSYFSISTDPGFLLGGTEATFGFWIKINQSTTFTTNSIITRIGNVFTLSYTSDSTFNMAINVSNTTNTKNIAFSSSNFPFDQWNFVVLRAGTALSSSSGGELFINSGSTPVNTVTITQNNFRTTSATTQFGSIIQGQSGVSDGYVEWNGMFITKTKFSDSQMTSIYNGTLDPSTLSNTIVLPMNGRNTGDTPSVDDESLTDIGDQSFAFTNLVGSPTYIDTPNNHTWGQVISSNSALDFDTRNMNFRKNNSNHLNHISQLF